MENMVAIPPNEVTQADLEAWYLLDEELKRVKSKEMMLRNKIFKGLFLSPREGTNNLGLPDGAVIKGQHVINRSIDPAALTAMTEKFNEENIFVDQLVEWKPQLKTGAYRELTAEQRQVFDQCLIIKEGSPSLEITYPKRRIADLQMAPLAASVPPVA